MREKASVDSDLHRGPAWKAPPNTNPGVRSNNTSPSLSACWLHRVISGSSEDAGRR